MPQPQTQDPRVLAKRTSNALDRLDNVEKTITGLIAGINNSLGGLHQQLNSQGEVLEAVVQSLGRETVETIIKESRERRATEQMENEKKALEELKGRGDVAVVEKVTDKSIIVGREYNADGTLRHPGRVQVAFQRVDAQFQAGLLDKPAGFVLDLPNGNKFEILEVLEVVQKPDAPAEAPKAPETPAPEAVAAATTADAAPAEAKQ